MSRTWITCEYICPHCDIIMEDGIALLDILGGIPDFAGDSEVCTVSPSGNARVVKCKKCPKCGHSQKLINNSKSIRNMPMVEETILEVIDAMVAALASCDYVWPPESEKESYDKVVGVIEGWIAFRDAGNYGGADIPDNVDDYLAWLHKIHVESKKSKFLVKNKQGCKFQDIKTSTDCNNPNASRYCGSCYSDCEDREE